MNPAKRVLVASLALITPQSDGWHLVDATPHLPEQLDLMHESYPNLGLMESVFLTHAHIGHYTGLMYLGKEAVSASNIVVWCGQRMGDILKNHVPWRQLVDLNNIRPVVMHDNQAIRLSHELSVTPLLVPHRNEFSETYGFIIQGPHKRLLYVPDIDRWEAWDRGLLSVANSVDYCLLDATFFSVDELAARGRDYATIPHPLVKSTMDLLQSAADNGKHISFIHINHTNPLLRADSAASRELASRGFYVAKQGDEFYL